MGQFDGSPDTTAKFQVHARDTVLVVEGCDDDGDPFVLTLDKLWCWTLMQEIGDWLGCDTQGLSQVPTMPSEQATEVFQRAWQDMRDVPEAAWTADYQRCPPAGDI